MSAPDRRAKLDPDHPHLSMRRQCAMLGAVHALAVPRLATDDGDIAGRGSGDQPKACATADAADGRSRPRSYAGGGGLDSRLRLLPSRFMFRAGMYLEQPTLPAKLGYEAAGTVEAIGEGVTGFAIGDKVSTIPGFSMNHYGVYGEQAIVPAAMTVKHPAGLSWEQAAAIWMQYMTAYGGLIEVARLARGDAVIITASSSSVGLAAIQIVNAVGAVSIATTRKSGKRNALLGHGAQHVIATQEQDLVEEVKRITGGKGARIVFDPVAGEGVETLAQATAQRGTIILYGALAQSATPFPLFAALGKGLTLRGYTLFEVVRDTERMAKGQHYVLDGLASGKLKPVIAKIFPFDKIADAHRFMESNEQIGKIIVTVD